MPTWKFVHPGGGDLAFPSGVEVPDDWVFVDVPSVELPAAEGDLWDPVGADTDIYRVMFQVIANDAAGLAIAGVYVGREIDSAGGLAVPYYWMFNETIPFPSNSGWYGPYYIHGDDAIRGVAADANDASIHFDVRRVL